jgi:putative hemolysin
LKDTLALMAESPHSRFPVYSGDTDMEILGVIRAKDLLGGSLSNAEQLRTLIRDAPIIPEALDALDFVDTLKKSPVHVGLVHDEYGHFVGIVTPADILEAIVGAFATEEGAAEEAIVRRADGSLLMAGWMPIDELAEALGLILPEGRTFATAAGFLIHAFGRLQAVGDQVNVQQWSFEVVDLDGRRIDKLLATKCPIVSLDHALLALSSAPAESATA